MKAHELLDCDHQPTADNAADLLRTMARIIDNLRYLEDLVPGGTAAWLGYADAMSVIAAHWRIQSGEAPVEDWLDDQWAPKAESAGAEDVPFDSWSPAAKARLVRDILRETQGG